jgi:hypothetical protein
LFDDDEGNEGDDFLLSKTMADETNAAKPGRWEESKAKAFLRAEIISGAIRPDMKPKAVFNMHPEEYGKWRYVNWSSNLTTLRKAIARDRDRMQKDAISYGKTVQIVREKYPRSTQTVWHLSPAARLLKQDVDDGKNAAMKPKELYESRPEYQTFSLAVFRKHIYQEVDSRPKHAIRFEKKKKKWLYPELHADHPRLRSNDNGTENAT